MSTFAAMQSLSNQRQINKAPPKSGGSKKTAAASSQSCSRLSAGLSSTTKPRSTAASAPEKTTAVPAKAAAGGVATAETVQTPRTKLRIKMQDAESIATLTDEEVDLALQEQLLLAEHLIQYEAVLELDQELTSRSGTPAETTEQKAADGTSS